MSGDEADGPCRTGADAQSAAEASPRIKSNRGCAPGRKLATLRASSAVIAQLGVKSRDEPRLGNGIAVIEALQSVEKPTAARATGADRTDLPVSLAIGQVHQTGLVRAAQHIQRFFQRDGS